MKVELDIVDAAAWTMLSDPAHKLIFGKSRPPEHNRIDFALVPYNAETEDPLAYATVRELDHESVYWQFGGAVPEIQNTVLASRIYRQMIAWTKERYRRVTTLVESENVRYLRFAMAHGFRVIGVRMFEGQVLVELLLDFSKETTNA